MNGLLRIGRGVVACAALAWAGGVQAQVGLLNVLDEDQHVTIADVYTGEEPNGDLTFERTTRIGRLPDKTMALEHIAPAQLGATFGIDPVNADYEFGTFAKVMGVVVGAEGSNFSASGALNGLFGQSGNIRVVVPCLSDDPDRVFERLDEEGTLAGAGAYGVGFDRLSYQQSYAAYTNWLAGGAAQPTEFGNRQVTGAQFSSELFGCSVRGTAVNPIAGNPDSIQYQQVADGLDLAQQATNPEDSAWGLGLRVGRINYGGAAGTQAAIRLSRNTRFSEGSRAFLAFDTPITYQKVGDVEELRFYTATSLVLPLSSRFTITPRVSFGFAHSGALQLDGLVAAATVSATYAIPNLIGRGVLTLGGMAGYSKATHVFYMNQRLEGVGPENTTWRGAAAYELPLSRRFLGRGGSARASYALTRLSGDALFVRTVHELSASVGVRSRGSEARNAFELLRLGVIGRIARQSNAAHLFLGWRF